MPERKRFFSIDVFPKIKVFFKIVFSFNSKIKLSIFINKNERGIDSLPLLPTILMGNTGGLRFKDKLLTHVPNLTFRYLRMRLTILEDVPHKI